MIYGQTNELKSIDKRSMVKTNDKPGICDFAKIKHAYIILVIKTNDSKRHVSIDTLLIYIACIINYHLCSDILLK